MRLKLWERLAAHRLEDRGLSATCLRDGIEDLDRGWRTCRIEGSGSPRPINPQTRALQSLS